MQSLTDGVRSRSGFLARDFGHDEARAGPEAQSEGRHEEVAVATKFTVIVRRMRLAITATEGQSRSVLRPARSSNGREMIVS